MAIVIHNVWAQASQCAKEITSVPFDSVEELMAISACLTEAHDYLWQAVVKADTVGYLEGPQFATFICRSA